MLRRLVEDCPELHHAAALLPSLSDPSEKPRAKKRVLVVDDEASVTLLCSYVLGDAGYEVETATTADAAVALIEHGSFDAFLIDLVMPEGGGVRVIRAAQHWAPETPLVVMTAEPPHLAPPRAGMEVYLHKPFDGLLALEQVVADAVNIGRRRDALHAQPAR